MVLADLPSSEGDAVARELGGATAFVPADVSVILSKSHPLGFQNALLISPIHWASVCVTQAMILFYLYAPLSLPKHCLHHYTTQKSQRVAMVNPINPQ